MITALLAVLITLANGDSSVEVETFGARVISARLGGEDVFWNADPVQTNTTEWAHGGLPIAWPWFSCEKGDIGNIHGYAWKSEFTIKERTANRLVLTLNGREGLKLEYTIALEDELKLQMVTRNESGRDHKLSCGFHPYFLVGERDRCLVNGGGIETPLRINRSIDDAFAVKAGSFAVYRLADEVKNRTIVIEEENCPRVNVWNPGAMAGCPGLMPANEWRRFVAVEPYITRREPVTLKAGGWHQLKMRLRVDKGTKLTGFIGRDSRIPGCEEERFQLPFKALFIGAHPDDAEYQFGATAAKLVRAGAKVTFVSICNGDNGHQTMQPEELAARRYLETQAAAKTYGIERYIVMGEHDCIVEPTVELRKRVTRLIRELKPNMVVTHRTCDYHADHRATAQVVQDSTYLIGVPLFASESPVPEILPFVLYAGDRFTVPRPLRPDMIVDGDDELDIVARSFVNHESQVLEWLPPELGLDPKDVPQGFEARVQFVKEKALIDPQMMSCPQTAQIRKAIGRDSFKLVNFFEICEYSRPPCEKERKFLSAIPGIHWSDGK